MVDHLIAGYEKFMNLQGGGLKSRSIKYMLAAPGLTMKHLTGNEILSTIMLLQSSNINHVMLKNVLWCIKITLWICLKTIMNLFSNYSWKILRLKNKHISFPFHCQLLIRKYSSSQACQEVALIPTKVNKWDTFRRHDRF